MFVHKHLARPATALLVAAVGATLAAERGAGEADRRLDRPVSAALRLALGRQTVTTVAPDSSPVIIAAPSLCCAAERLSGAESVTVIAASLPAPASKAATSELQFCTTLSAVPAAEICCTVLSAVRFATAPGSTSDSATP